MMITRFLKASLLGGVGIHLVSCFSRNDSNSEPALETTISKEVAERPYIRYQCYFFEVPADFLRDEVGEDASSTKVYSQEEGDQLVKELEGKRGFKLTSTPAVKCRNGQKGTMQLHREFIYPTEYLPPQIPKEAGEREGVFPVTPSTPTAFETRNVGLEASFQGTKNSEGVVDFNYYIQSTDFLGFINYGSPITAPAKGLLGQTVTVTLTENRIEMPIFDSKRLSSQATLSHGEYLAVGKWGRDAQPSLDEATRPQQEALEKSSNLYVLIQVELTE